MIYGGRWETLGILGKGGQSEIFEAIDRHAPSSEPVALKRIKNPKRLSWFFDEAEAIARLDHPNIIKLIEFSAFENAAEGLRQAYLVMPRAQGGDLSTRAARYEGDLDGTLIVAKQIAMALLAAHKAGVIHRDVKPSNILFTGLGHDIWLTDFGVCLLKDQKAVTPRQENIGPTTLTTLEHDLVEDLHATEAGDIYSLGMVIYYMITGGRKTAPPDVLAEADNAIEFSHQSCSPMIQFLLGNMICRHEARLRTMTDVIRCLEQFKN